VILGGKSLADLSLDDIRLLVDNRVPESRHLDYKETPYSGRAQDIREMLRDITALANADGGYLVLGVREDGTNRPVELVPFDNPQELTDSMLQACVDGIRDRIPGLEIAPFEIAFNQGIIIIHVPASEWRPHMVVRDRRTDFCLRYGTHKREMTLREIREMILGDSRYCQLVEPQLRTRGALEESEKRVEGVIPPYAKVITERPVERFLLKYLLGGVVPRTMMIISPFIGDLEGAPVALKEVTKKVEADGTRLYVITREPREPYHQAGVSVLQQCRLAEIRYNPDIHAKLYLAWCRDETESYALFGSGNLTERGLRYNLELGMMIFARGYGKTILRDLYNWSTSVLRPKTPPVKRIDANWQRD